MAEWRKAIPESRDRLQSKVLVWVVESLLCMSCVLLLTMAATEGFEIRRLFFAALAISAGLAVLVWRVRAGTAAAALCGASICLLVTFAGGLDQNASALHSGFLPLTALFVLTFGATRAGRARKASAGLAESRKGRNAGQVIANLGAAGLVGALILVNGSSQVWTLMMVAALCESTADTMSSEIGQAFGGRPVMLTTLRRAEVGADGAVTLLGTAAGALGSAIVAAVGMWAMRLTPWQALLAWAGGIAGLFFDSLLGATVESKGWLGNDLVNFSSTAFAALVAFWLEIFFDLR